MLQATGGDDYEVCFTAAPALRKAVAGASRTCGVPVTRIGEIAEGSGALALDADDRPWQPARTGYAHFGNPD